MRKTVLLLLLAAATTGAAPPAEPVSASGSARADAPAPAPKAELPGFAADLADRPMIAGPDGWTPISYATAWSALAKASPDRRQAARWAYARSLIGGARGGEASGVLDVMLQDDPDLALVPAWQLARGVASAQAGRSAQALTALGGPALAANSEACLWRMLAMAGAELPRQALGQVACAGPALASRRKSERARFVLAAAGAAIDAGRPALALDWLRRLPDRDAAANLLRGKAELALGRVPAGRLRLERVAKTGLPEQRADAGLGLIETGVAARTLTPAAAIQQLDALRFAWRGGRIEERALHLTWTLANAARDDRHALAAGATLFRAFDLGPDTAPMASALHARLAAALAPGSAMPIAAAAGLYWDYRDLAPAGVEGDRLVGRLADRLSAAGLYARAAELLGYQLTARAQDVAQGPLSVKVAGLHILAGRPDRALATLRATDKIAYPDEMLWDRRRVGAAALQLLGKTAEALSVLDDVPNAEAMRAEIRWKARDWEGLVAGGGSALPGKGPLAEVEQAVVLRHAIGLAMLGREAALTQLRGRYLAGFGTSPGARTFDVLTGDVGSIDPETLAQAMAALPSASPAGKFGDLLDVEVAGRKG